MLFDGVGPKPLFQIIDFNTKKIIKTSFFGLRRLILPPGLHPFSKQDQDLFFGREEQVDALLRKLEEKRFVVVTGPAEPGNERWSPFALSLTAMG